MDERLRGLARRPDWPETSARPVVTPLQPSVVYRARDPDALDAQYEAGEGFVYAREGHPNAEVLARKIDQLEGLEGGVITGSGMAALSAVFLGLLKAGDHVLGGDQLYGRSLRLLGEDLPRMGFATSLADPTDIAAMRAAIRPETRMILIEVVSNPTLRVADLEGIAALARETGALLMVDNTFTTPLGLRPADFGADIVVHSVTKLLAGHADVTLGYVAARDPELGQAIRVAAASWGLTPSPFDCWLAERGVQTFELRHARAEQSAVALAQALADLPGIVRVIHPSRADHPDQARARQILDGQGGNMLSFEIAGGRAAANTFARACAIPFAPTLGDVSSTLSHPPSSSHRALSPEGRAALGISEGFFRLSVGLEPADQLLDEIRKALEEALSS